MDIKPHTIKKHRALGYYFKIIRDLISYKDSPFKHLYYADLYCGDGICDVEQTDEHYEPPIILSILKPAKEKKLPITCFINDSNKDNIEKLKEKTKDYQEFIAEYGNEDANTYYQKVLAKIPTDQFSIFFLDPTNHDHLKWKTIEGISKHTHSYKNYYREQVRRPEIIINFMTYSMLQSYKAKSYDSITGSLGTDIWKKRIEYYKKRSDIHAPVEGALLDTFTEQLKKLGYSVTTPMPILGTESNAAIYYLFWATNKRGFQIIEKRITDYMTRMLNVAQKDNEVNISKIRAKKDKMVPLSQFF